MDAPARRRPAGAIIATGSVSGLPVPRFVSLKSDRVNVRSGPNKDQDVRWVYTRAGMPVEITAEFENWRRIRDWEGAEGWVYHSLLSGKRSAVVVPTLKDDLVPLYEQPGCRIRGDRPPAIGRARPAEILQRHLVPSSRARISTAGSARSGCGAPIRTRRWNKFPLSSSAPACAGAGSSGRSSIPRNFSDYWMPRFRGA